MSMPYRVMGEKISAEAFINDSRWEWVIKAATSAFLTSHWLRPRSRPQLLEYQTAPLHRLPPPHVLHQKLRRIYNTLRYPSFRRKTSGSSFGEGVALTFVMWRAACCYCLPARPRSSFTLGGLLGCIYNFCKMPAKTSISANTSANKHVRPKFHKPIKFDFNIINWKNNHPQILRKTTLVLSMWHCSLAVLEPSWVDLKYDKGPQAVT